MVEVNPALVFSILAVLPPAGIFFAAYGRYDGAFQDNVVFLYFMGGLLMGFLVGFMTILSLGGLAPLWGVLAIALLWPITLVVGINRRKWQGERHAIFNGGAFGIGVAVMLAFTFLFVLFRRYDLTATIAVQALVFVSGVAGLLFGLGLLAGNGVRTRRPFRSALLGTAILVAPAIFLVSFVGNVSPPAPEGVHGPWDAATEGASIPAQGGFNGTLTLSGTAPDTEGITLRLVNASGYHEEVTVTNATFIFTDLQPGVYRLEAWVETDGERGAGATETRGALLHPDGTPTDRNLIRVEADIAGVSVEPKEAPTQGWVTAARIRTAAETPPNASGVWLWSILLIAYGGIFAVAAEKKLLILGVTDEARRRRRRLRRGAD